MPYSDCEICGETFKKWAGQKFCSDYCYSIHKNRKARVAALRVLQCKECGAAFNPRGPQITCSKECARSRKRRGARNHYIENSEDYKNRSSWRNLSKDRRNKAIYYNRENPQYRIKSKFKQQLGFTPPPELVEEATALRLLRRAIKKAGE